MTFAVSIACWTIAWYAALTLLNHDVLLASGDLLVAYYLQIALHEVGHLVAGLSGRFVFQSISVWPFVLERGGEHLRLGISARSRIGLTRMLPPSTVSRGRLVLFSGGGIAGNLVSAVAAAGWFFVAGGLSALRNLSTTRPDAVLLCFAAATAVFALRFALLSLIPLRQGRYRSDGARLLDELRGGDRYERSRAIGRLAAASATGDRLPDAGRVLDAARRPLDLTHECMAGHVQAYLYGGLDAPVDTARRDLEIAMASSCSALPSERQELIFHAAFQAIILRDFDGAERWSRRISRETLDEMASLQLDAGLAWARGDVREAERLCDQLRQRLSVRIADPQSRAAAEASMQRWLGRLRGAPAPATPTIVDDVG